MTTPNFLDRIQDGSPFPRGATWTGQGVNFALFSANATRVELCFYDQDGKHEIGRIDMPEYTDEVWHVFVPELGPGTVYGYRVHGPYEPENGHRFNHNKLLLDPYAKRHIGELTWTPEVFGYTIGAEDEDLSFDERDSAPFVPKCVVVDHNFSFAGASASRVPWDKCVFYETHVRGYTKRHPAVPEELRGTFAGLAVPEVVAYIKNLGVTSVELMPVHSFVNDDYLLEKGLTNYWGYNSLGFFAADPRYFSTGEIAEFKNMIKTFHDAGLEVILDVVYNHTAEGNEKGPTLSFKGIDNASYYRLPDNRRHYINDTGTGNTLNLSHPRVLQMVCDSLRYWVTEMGVDGFRFDLATILGRLDHGFDESSGFLQACSQDPILTSVKMIAEPWDCGPGGYQVGRFPPGWAEWNDRFRDDVRAFWKGDDGTTQDFARRITGSADKFQQRGRRPWAGVNFITAHDGFCLNDLVSYNDKHNEANGEDSRDGSSDNRSWNCGVEGPTDDAEVRALRERQKRNLLSSLIFAQGTPMILAGDELGRTQQGNNNAYCQDNEISWLDWEAIDDDGRALQEFTRNLLTLRRTLPVLHRGRFLSGEADPDTGITDATWISPAGEPLTQEQWHDESMHTFGLIIDGRARASGIKRPADDTTLLMVFNSYHDLVNFTLPAVKPDAQWTCLVDTNMPVRSDLPTFAPGEVYGVTGRSVLLFSMAAKGETGRVLHQLGQALTSDQ